MILLTKELDIRVWFVHSIIMLKFGETKVTKEKIYAAKKPRKIWDVNVDNIVISKLFETKTNSKYLIGYLDKLKMEIKIKTVN